MIDFRVAVRTTLLLVDDDIQQLDLLAFTMKMSGFTVVTASSPIEAISLMNQHCLRKIDVAVIDYHLPAMNGCVLAAYLKARYSELKIVLCSGALDISEDERMSVDAFISKSDGIGALLSKITEFGQIDPASPTLFALENDAFIEAVNRWVTHPRKALSCPAVRIWDITIKTLAHDPGRKRANVEASMGSQSDRSSDMMHAGAIANPILRLLICIVAVFVLTAVLYAVPLRDRGLTASLRSLPPSELPCA